ncbi:hypothetical protein [Bifidobacterium longum]|jgi:hypothetical protein|uniref:hypothetical protein n=1 Tax=Bifidobacterium longum TaxID=216816 RepID=UPI0018A0EE83|nr:hypothetical protein [Bifidobacterium longum]MDB6790035.1 hypothetical protein [Bifidobacterium longum]
MFGMWLDDVYYSRLEILTAPSLMCPDVRKQVFRIEDITNYGESRARPTFRLQRCSWFTAFRSWLADELDTMRENIALNGWRRMFDGMESFGYWLYNYKEIGMKPFIGGSEVIDVAGRLVTEDGRCWTMSY